MYCNMIPRRLERVRRHLVDANKQYFYGSTSLHRGLYIDCLIFSFPDLHEAYINLATERVTSQ